MDAAPDYFLGTSEGERARLIAQAEMHSPESAALFDDIGVGAGWHAIDIGCGPLGVLDLLSARVGESGSVVGLDQSAQMLDGAARSIRERELGNVRLVQALGDETRRTDASFDLVHARLVLINVPNPGHLVEEMVRIAKPGGWVVVQDYDWISLACSPGRPSWDLLANCIRAVWEHRGCDVGIGRQVPGLLAANGLVDVTVRAQQRVWRSGDMFHGFALWVAVMLRDEVLAIGDVSAAEFDAAIAEVRAHLAAPDTISLHPLQIQAWGRRPGR